MGKGQTTVRAAVDDIRTGLPFRVQGLESDHGSAFIHDHLVQYCATRAIQVTRGRPSKKDDTAHSEQKN